MFEGDGFLLSFFFFFSLIRPLPIFIEFFDFFHSLSLERSWNKLLTRRPETLSVVQSVVSFLGLNFFLLFFLFFFLEECACAR